MSEPVIPERKLPMWSKEILRELAAREQEGGWINIESIDGIRIKMLEANLANQTATIAELKEVVHKYQYESMLWRDKERDLTATIDRLTQELKQAKP